MLWSDEYSSIRNVGTSVKTCAVIEYGSMTIPISSQLAGRLYGRFWTAIFVVVIRFIAGWSSR